MTGKFSFKQFLEDFAEFQERMLYLHKDEAQEGLESLYASIKIQLIKDIESAGKIEKNDRSYLQLKQAQKILRYVDELSVGNNNLLKLSENEILHLFEKQYKFKKILVKFSDEN